MYWCVVSEEGKEWICDGFTTVNQIGWHRFFFWLTCFNFYIITKHVNRVIILEFWMDMENSKKRVSWWFFSFFRWFFRWLWMFWIYWWCGDGIYMVSSDGTLVFPPVFQQFSLFLWKFVFSSIFHRVIGN